MFTMEVKYRRATIMTTSFVLVSLIAAQMRRVKKIIVPTTAITIDSEMQDSISITIDSKMQDLISILNMHGPIKINALAL